MKAKISRADEISGQAKLNDKIFKELTRLDKDLRSLRKNVANIRASLESLFKEGEPDENNNFHTVASA